MAPAFGRVEAKGFLPYFMDTAAKACKLRWHLILRADSGTHPQLADKWSDIIEDGKSGGSAVIDVNMWLGRATLDAYVLVPVSAVHIPRANHELISQKGRCRSFRVRLWRIRWSG